MERQKRWQLYLIITVIILTVYNILPTVFYYANPLKKSIDGPRANQIALNIESRVNDLEDESIAWLKSYSDLLHVKPLSVALNPSQPRYVNMGFKSVEDAKAFRSYFPRAGALIPFVPAQLSLYDETNENASKNVVIQRRIPVHLDPEQVNTFFQYSPKVDDQGKVTDLYRALVDDRALQLGIALGGTSENAQFLTGIIGDAQNPQIQDLAVLTAQNILSFSQAFGEDSAIANRYFATYTQGISGNADSQVRDFIASLEHIKDKFKLERISLQTEQQTLQAQGAFLDIVKQQRMELLTKRETTLTNSIALVKRHTAAFASGKTPWTYASLGAEIQASALKLDPASNLQVISLGGRSPMVDQMVIDWRNEKIILKLYPDLLSFKAKLDQSKGHQYQKDQVDQWIYNEVASVGRQAGESISPYQEAFEISLNQLQNSKSFLAMKLGNIAKAEAVQLKETITTHWAPKHPDLKKESFPIWDFETYQALPPEQQKLGLVIYAPAVYPKMPPSGFRMNSIYIIAKGIDQILQKVKSAPESDDAKQFLEDFNNLRSLLQNNGYFGYSGSSFALSSEYANDFIFEAEDYFQTVLSATREDFTVHGTKRYAILEFSDVEQRILTENKIETRMHEDLLKWRDDYRSAQLDIKGASPYDVPAPTQNVLWDNLKLSAVKYFRGDDRKILRWGLDLSGGKTVQIELRDSNNRVVTDPMDIKQGINELYNRVNKLGVSEVSIRQEGNYITLDFPGSQGLSASELVKASSMYFNVVNEKFTPGNTVLADSVNRFLQEVWNEAVVTNRKDLEEINLIAYKHLYGDSSDPEIVQPRSDAASTLYENGLRFSNPEDMSVTGIFNDTYSKIAVFRGKDFTDWQGQTNPLLIVFRNYALEGSNLENVHASYDPSKGNYLSFGVKGAQSTKSGQKINPRDDIFAWTSQFSKEKIVGTPNETYSKGRGWRMAVILNGSIISSPTLDSPLRDSAMITGSFTQREVNQLESDLKAGSLSFTPHILSEKNVSPELGAKERSKGVLAIFLALVLVIATMCIYYRFAGVVASVAVIFNLLIMWATLQNLQATLTLASMAGIILALAIAVDANVLVFERIKEEYAVSKRIASAVHAGYKKAFSAIIDSNVTTFIAALILLQFDSGPIKGFAITLIVGIVSSLLTALFMTRFFFAGWVQNPEHKELKMMNLIKSSKFDFLKRTKLTVFLSAIVILIGSYLVVAERHTILGMDFTGGFSLSVELQQKPGANYRQEVEGALIEQGATTQDFQIRELTPSNNIRIFLSESLQQPGHPFYGMPLQTEEKDVAYPYENNPKIVWVVNALDKAGLAITPQSLAHLHKNWTEISGQMSDTMRTSAILGLAFALLCILIYITVRFEFKYAISATICLAHDVVFTVGMLAVLHAFGVPIQIDLNTVAALMTIIGYSLNDTIIVFDRIRENVRHMRKSSFSEIINNALNVTLSRTLMTSGMTLLVLIPMVAIGGSTVFGFSLVMMIGVIFGTLSSLFIAAPLMQYFHNKELQKQDKLVTTVL